MMKSALNKNPKIKDGEPDVLKLRTTEMNALLYLLLRVKSNSRTDAEIYSDSIFPIVHNLEDKVSEAKVKYDKQMKPVAEKIEELEKEIDLLLISTDKDVAEVDPSTYYETIPKKEKKSKK